MPIRAPEERFSGRVEAYHAGRPRYPQGIVDTLCAKAGLTPNHIIADIGCGTGISSEPFLKHGNRVYGVEPNYDMLEGAKLFLADHPNFTAIAGSAEQTGLSGGTIDWVVAGQAFHWFDRDRAKPEFRRILASGGKLALFWNVRINEGAFQEAFETLVNRYATDYRGSGGGVARDSGNLKAFFGGTVHHEVFSNDQKLDLAGLQSRMFSCSYIPPADKPEGGEISAELADLFNRYQSGGLVTIQYETKLYWGKIR